MSGNTIANMRNGTTNASTAARGVVWGVLAYNGTNTVTNNVIHDLTIANANNAADNTLAAAGIMLINTTDAVQTISGNEIYKLSNSSGSFAGSVAGIYYSGFTTAGAVSGNFIHDLSVTGASSTDASIFGIKTDAGATTYSNNIISLGGNSKTTLYGIYESGAAANDNSLYFNTVYLGGTLGAGSTNKSYALYSAAATNTRNFRNNIFSNARSTTSGSSLHYAAYFNYAVSDNLTLDNNNYYAPGTGGVPGYYNSANVNSLPLITGQDANSILVDPLFSRAGGTLADDYLPSAAGLTAATGTGILTDYGDNSRNISTPSMGAWEFTPVITCANPTNGGTIAAAQTICTGLTPSAFTSSAAPSGHTGTLEYKWQSSVTSSSAGFSDIASSNAATYAPGTLTVTTWYKRVARVDCKSDWTGAVESNAIQISIDPASVGGTITGSASIAS